jgi:uncharacterized protein YbbC (DUF1343 family)
VLRCIRLCFSVSLLLSLACPHTSYAAAVKTGADVLIETGFAPLKGKKFALVTNQSAQLSGVHLVDALVRAGAAPTLIFTPEHGFLGAAEDGVQLADGTVAGIPIKSLYGASKKPRVEDLKGLDLVLFDIQDAGVRFYTYISTMGLAMQAAAEAGVPFLVLDRPNPLGGNYVSGFVRQDLPASFTSLYRIPEAHGMTVGELAGLIKGEGLLPGLSHLDLRVVQMQGWQRSMRWPDTGLPWIATSPNLAQFDAALLYPGIGLIEATSASEGRGTELPFQLVGWPGVDPQALARQLNAQQLAGLHFEPARFTPVSLLGKSSAPKYRNRELGGVRIEVTDFRAVLPVEAGVAVVCAFYAALPEPARKIFFRPGFDDMAGSRQLRLAVQAGEPAEAVDARFSGEIRRFLNQRQGYLLYPDEPAPR